MVFIVVKDGINQQQWEYDGYILVGGLEHFLSSPIVGMMIQFDFHIFQGAGIPPISISMMLYPILEPGSNKKKIWFPAGCRDIVWGNLDL
jgi:hypothetical protein